MTQQPQRTSAADWGFTRIQRSSPNESPFSPPQSIFAPTHHAPHIAYLSPVHEVGEDQSMKEESMTELMCAVSRWQVTTPETVRGVPDPVPTIPSSFCHEPLAECERRSINSHFTSRRATSRSAASNPSCGVTCRFEELDDVSMSGERAHDSAVSAAWEVPADDDAYMDDMSLGD